jgi:predicted phage-related endonuclease
MRMGQLLEAAIADAYAEREARQLRRVGTVWHRSISYLYCHPDRAVVGERGLVEVKTSIRRDLYEGGPPPHVVTQAQWQQHLTRRDWCDVVVLSGPADIDVHRVWYDSELGAMLEEQAVSWWERHVIGGEPPAADGSTAYRRWLQERHPAADPGSERAPTPEEAAAIHELRSIRQSQAKLKAQADTLLNQLAAAMGDTERLVAPDATVTYREQQGRVDWKAAAAALVDDTAQLDAIAEQHRGAPTRTPRVTYRKELG